MPDVVLARKVKLRLSINTHSERASGKILFDGAIKGESGGEMSSITHSRRHMHWIVVDRVIILKGRRDLKTNEYYYSSKMHRFILNGWNVNNGLGL